MGLSWRHIVIIVGISFGLGAVVASYKVIFAQLSQTTAAFSNLELPGSGPSGGSRSNSDISTSSQVSLTQPTPTDLVPDSVFIPERGDLRIIVFSDINGRYRSTTYRQEVLNSIRLLPAWEPDLVLCAGDVVAGQLLSLTAEEIQVMWDGFDRHIFQPIRQAGIPFAIALGKHDGSSQVFEEDAFSDSEPAFVEAQGIPSGIPGTYIFDQERTAAKAYWTDPTRDLGLELVNGANFPFRYSFVHNDAFVLVWEASSPDLSEEDLVWAEQQLSSPTAQRAKMRLSMGHFPLYAISQGRDRPSEFLTQGQEVHELLETYEVHAHISGHHHAYYPGYVGNVELLYSGALGAGPRHLLGADQGDTDEVNSTPPLRTLTVMDIFFDRLPQLTEPLDELSSDEGAKDRSAISSTNGVSNGLTNSNFASLDASPVPPITAVYTTYNMGTMNIIEPDDLPRVVAGPTGLVLRQGINRRDLSYEDNQRYRRSW